VAAANVSLARRASSVIMIALAGCRLSVNRRQFMPFNSDNAFFSADTLVKIG
jgi:hypothetical protein